MESTTILIGVQARTNSERLPNKMMKKILGMPVIDHTINAALTSSKYMNKYSHKTGVSTQVWALVPEGDPLEAYLSKRNDIAVYAGHPTDLVERFNDVVQKVNPDYIVRLTGDCPLLLPFLVTKSINTAIHNKYDFTDNANPKYRTFFDGTDVEVMSRKAFDWLNENAKEREHVCSNLRNESPEWVRKGAVYSHIDLSSFKFSIDTKKDFELVNNLMKSLKHKKVNWEEEHGKYTSHMF